MIGMLDFIKKYFPKKVDSFDKFVEMVRKEKGASIVIEPGIKVKPGMFTEAAEIIGVYEYFIRFQSKTTRGGPIIYDEFYASRFGSEYGTADSDEREVYTSNLLSAAYHKLQQIKERLPNVETVLKVENSKNN